MKSATPKQSVRFSLPLLTMWAVASRELAVGHYLMDEPKEAAEHEQQALYFQRLIDERQYERPQIAIPRGELR